MREIWFKIALLVLLVVAGYFVREESARNRAVEILTFCTKESDEYASQGGFGNTFFGTPDDCFVRMENLTDI